MSFTGENTMKNSRKMLGIAIVAAAAFGMGAGAVAEDMAAPMSPTAGAGMGKGGGKMAEELGLSGEKATQFKDEMKQHHATMKGLMDKGKMALEKLDAAVQAKAADAELTADLDALDAVRKDMEAEKTRNITAMRAMLDPMQQAQMALKEAKHMMSMMGGMEGGESMHAKPAPEAGATK